MISKTRLGVEKRAIPSYRFHNDPLPPLQREEASRIYPYPKQDDVTDERYDRMMDVVTLDNGLVRVTILPGLGGHVLSMEDLQNGQEALHANLPLKFGLISIRGAWWAGGIEFNFPQVGHTVTTSDPVPWHTRENADGSATLFIGCVERITRMAWTVGLTLKPRDLRLHVNVYLINRTDFFNRIYFWSNTGVAAREDFRFLLPATEVFAWWAGSRGVTDYPVHKGRDHSKFVTNTKPGDIFAKDLRDNWFGCYYDKLDRGVLHHASRFDVQGRKFWTWGTADDAKVWAKLLSEKGDPYIEIQSGRFVHQGIQRLMEPQAVEEWSESWAPVWGMGNVIHSAETVAVNLEKRTGDLALKLFPMVDLKAGTVSVKQDGKALLSQKLKTTAGKVAEIGLKPKRGSPLEVRLESDERTIFEVALPIGRDVVVVNTDREAPYLTVNDENRQADEPKTPGAHLLQARAHEESNSPNAAAASYVKALALDPKCAPAMAGLAQIELKQGRPRKGDEWASKALAVDPECQEAMWWKGVAQFMGSDASREAAESAHLWALRRHARYAASALSLQGRLAMRRGDFATALECLEQSLSRNPRNCRNLALASLAARRTGNASLASEYLSRCYEANPLEPMLWSEKHFQGFSCAEGFEKAAVRAMGEDLQACLEAVSDYAGVWDWESARAGLSAMEELGISDPPGELAIDLWSAYAAWKSGDVNRAISSSAKVAAQSPIFAMPHRFEELDVLRACLGLHPESPMLHYLLGCLLASMSRWGEAAGQWREAERNCCDAELAVLLKRNLGLAKWLKEGNCDAAVELYAKAVEKSRELKADSPLAVMGWWLWIDFDNLLKAMGRQERRVAEFDAAPSGVRARPEVLARCADAMLRLGRPEKTLEVLNMCRFNPWECEVRSKHLWKEAQMLLGHRARESGDFATARGHYEAAADYPEHLNVGRSALNEDADALFWAGFCALESGAKKAAAKLLKQAAEERQPAQSGAREFKERAVELLRRL
ncbi:MAG TPA: DUF5107 domain-containing protein [Candidatus Brocadiia bacterium]|nr:DUF5107 domain-containing protein [Candidatus Brocadiia bacterium]